MIKMFGLSLDESLMMFLIVEHFVLFFIGIPLTFIYAKHWIMNIPIIRSMIKAYEAKQKLEKLREKI